jgi:hypothetical protein
MIGFSKEHRQRFRVRLEEAGLRADPYAWIIPGSRGEIYVHGPDTFGVATKGKRRKLRALPRLTITQDGDDGFNAVFPAERLKNVARMIGAYRRRHLSPEQRAACTERLRQINKSEVNRGSDGKNDQRHHPEASVAS